MFLEIFYTESFLYKIIAKFDFSAVLIKPDNFQKMCQIFGGIPTFCVQCLQSVFNFYF